MGGGIFGENVPGTRDANSASAESNVTGANFGGQEETLLGWIFGTDENEFSRINII